MRASGGAEVDESYFGARRVRGERGRVASGRTPVFGPLKRYGKVYAEIMTDCSKATLRAFIRCRVASETITAATTCAATTPPRCRLCEHYRVNHGKNDFARGAHHINGIESFRSFARHRLQKFHGIAPHTFYLHPKECEWRFNHRRLTCMPSC